MDNKYDIFISYSRKDSEQVLSVVEKLQERGFSIWIDKDGIVSGDAFKSIIVRAIKNSDVFLFFSSKDSNESPWTVKEVNTAVHLKKTIIPIRLDDADYNDSILFDLVGLDFVDLVNEENRIGALDKLINTLRSKIAPEKEKDKESKITSKKALFNVEGSKVGYDWLTINQRDNVQESLPIEDCYNNGVSCYESENYTEAAAWFMKSANKGHASSQCYLGYLYAHGLGVKQSDEEAVNWYKKAAEQGDSLAQNNLGSMYREGRGVQRNVEEAARWFRIAASQGSALAQYNLAIMYLTGSGVPQNEAEAVKWYRAAAEQGLQQAQFSLGNMYRTGSGLKEKDESEAFKWFKKAAEQGMADAQHNLGYMYYNGCGTRRDIDEAINWLKKAAAQGHSGAKSALKMIMDSLQQ